MVTRNALGDCHGALMGRTITPSCCKAWHSGPESSVVWPAEDEIKKTGGRRDQMAR